MLDVKVYSETTQFRWAVRLSAHGEERVLQQARYCVTDDTLEWSNVPEILFPVEKFEPKT